MTKRSNARPARAIADVGAGVILATVDIAASPERVFRALTASDEVVRWWGSPEEYQTTSWTADLRVGGAWRAEGRGADGSPFWVEGEFLAVEPPRRIVQTWKPQWDGGHATTLTYLLEPIELGTRVTVRHEGFGDRADSCRMHGEGWERVLGWLARHAAAAAAGTSGDARRFFMLRLIPPRPTFAADMTAQEREVMQAHAAYWRGLLAEGTAVVFGPVGDPQGPWGLAVARADDEAAVRAIEAGDPAIRAERGFRYDALPMLSAVVAE